MQGLCVNKQQIYIFKTTDVYLFENI